MLIQKNKIVWLGLTTKKAFDGVPHEWILKVQIILKISPVK